VTRTVSERSEGVAAGFSTLVGTEQQIIKNNIVATLDYFVGFENVINPYGVGDASRKIVAFLLKQD
jgi:UDP-N-acetylglucosamine 2-epimerase (non-hydrolysing)